MNFLCELWFLASTSFLLFRSWKSTRKKYKNQYYKSILPFKCSASNFLRFIACILVTIWFFGRGIQLFPKVVAFNEHMVPTINSKPPCSTLLRFCWSTKNCNQSITRNTRFAVWCDSQKIKSHKKNQTSRTFS